QFLAPADGAERALETGRVADREELLTVRPGSLTAPLGRQSQVDLEPAVAGLAVPIGPAPGDVRFGGVDGFAHRGPPVGSWLLQLTIRRSGHRPLSTRRWRRAGVGSRLP